MVPLDIGKQLSVYFGLLVPFAGVIYAFHSGFGVGVAGLIVWLFLFCTVIARVWIADEPLRPRLIAHLVSPDYRILYRSIMTPIARWPRDWRLYDWALRLAVVYPIALVVLVWVVTGSAATIGTVGFIAEEDRWWPRLVAIAAITLGAFGLSFWKPTPESLRNV